MSMEESMTELLDDGKQTAPVPESKISANLVSIPGRKSADESTSAASSALQTPLSTTESESPDGTQEMSLSNVQPPESAHEADKQNDHTIKASPNPNKSFISTAKETHQLNPSPEANKIQPLLTTTGPIQSTLESLRPAAETLRNPAPPPPQSSQPPSFQAPNPPYPHPYPRRSYDLHPVRHQEPQTYRRSLQIPHTNTHLYNNNYDTNPISRRSPYLDIHEESFNNAGGSVSTAGPNRGGDVGLVASLVYFFGKGWEKGQEVWENWWSEERTGNSARSY